MWEEPVKRIYLDLIFIVAIGIVVALASLAQAQDDEVRKSLRASVTQRLGVDTDITFDYGRPGVKGRQIWGDIVPYGLYPGVKYSNNKPYPWRAGADENTTMTITKDILVEGKKLAAGNYGIHMIASETDWIVIFSKKNEEWGSYSYDEKNDALRITVTPVEAPHEEWLTFGFENLDGTSATVYLHWEKLKVPFKIAVAD
jgi:hypothetical protein